MTDDIQNGDGAEEKSEQEETPKEQQKAATSRVEIDDSNINAGYANFCRVSSTPEELILDLGLNPQPLTAGTTKVILSQRIILNHYTAKRLLHALGEAILRHERAFGVLETDFRKRVKTVDPS